MSTISVIVPVYNVEKYIRRCVDSILSQTFRDFELILVDDGSPDTCGTICDEYAQKDPRVVVIHQENGGLSAARNAGIDWAFANSGSQWLTFIDSDDAVYPQFLQVLFQTAINRQADICVCGLETFHGELSSTPGYNFSGVQVVTNPDACRMVYEGQKMRAVYVSACTKIYRKELFSDLRFPVGRLHEDQFLTYKLLYRANKIAEVGDRLYGYCVNPESITHSKFTVRRYDDLIACEEAAAFFSRKGCPEAASAAKRKLTRLTAEYAIMAGKARVSNMVPRKYRMSALKAIKTIKDMNGESYCEWFLAKYYPGTVKVYSYLRKGFRILRGKEKIMN